MKQYTVIVGVDDTYFLYHLKAESAGEAGKQAEEKVIFDEGYAVVFVIVFAGWIHSIPE